MDKLKRKISVIKERLANEKSNQKVNNFNNSSRTSISLDKLVLDVGIEVTKSQTKLNEIQVGNLCLKR